MVEAIENICKVKGNGTVKRVAAINWFKQFIDGNFDFTDQKQSGCPLTIDSEVVRQAVEENPITNQCKF